MNNSSKERNRQITTLHYTLYKLEGKLAQLIAPAGFQKREMVQYKGFYGTKENLYAIQRSSIEFRIEEVKQKLRNKGVKL